MDGYLVLAAALVGGGLILFAAEFFLPTGGLLLVAGVAAWATAVGVVLLNGTATEASVAVIGLAVGVPIAGGGSVWLWQRTAAKRMGLTPNAETAFDPAENTGLAALKGRYGTAVTPLRPAGAVVIDGRRYDAQSEGLFLDSGAGVRCVDVRAGRVVVRRADPPKLSDLTFDDPT